MNDHEIKMQERQNVKLSFYKTTGKWYAECEIEITGLEAIDTGLLVIAIIERQKALLPMALTNQSFYCVVSGQDESKIFCEQLILPQQFAA